MNKHKDAASMDQIKTAKTSNFLTLFFDYKQSFIKFQLR